MGADGNYCADVDCDSCRRMDLADLGSTLGGNRVRSVRDPGEGSQAGDVGSDERNPWGLVTDKQMFSEKIRYAVGNLIMWGSPALIFGEGAEGKSAWCMSLAADIANGTNRGVLWVTNDPDRPGRMLKPRWKAAEGPEGGLVAVDSSIAKSVLDDYRGFDQVYSYANRLVAGNGFGGVGVVVVDPITGFLGNADQHNNSEVRAALRGWGDFCDVYDLVMLWVSHVNKDEFKTAVNALGGSKGFQTYARTVIYFGPDPEDDAPDNARAAVLVKGNYSRFKNIGRRLVLGSVLVDLDELDEDGFPVVSDQPRVVTVEDDVVLDPRRMREKTFGRKEGVSGVDSGVNTRFVYDSIWGAVRGGLADFNEVRRGLFDAGCSKGMWAHGLRKVENEKGVVVVRFDDGFGERVLLVDKSIVGDRDVVVGACDRLGVDSVIVLREVLK